MDRAVDRVRILGSWRFREFRNCGERCFFAPTGCGLVGPPRRSSSLAAKEKMSAAHEKCGGSHDGARPRRADRIHGSPMEYQAKGASTRNGATGDPSAFGRRRPSGDRSRRAPDPASARMTARERPSSARRRRKRAPRRPSRARPGVARWWKARRLLPRKRARRGARKRDRRCLSAAPCCGVPPALRAIGDHGANDLRPKGAVARRAARPPRRGARRGSDRARPRRADRSEARPR